MAKKLGISKAEGYQRGIFTMPYDLAGMINAFGAEFVCWSVAKVSQGYDIKEAVEYWSMHVMCFNNFNFYHTSHQAACEALVVDPNEFPEELVA